MDRTIRRCIFYRTYSNPSPKFNPICPDSKWKWENHQHQVKQQPKDDEKMEVHTVGSRGGSPRTPIDAFNSPIVTCLARSMAWTTCCWCCGHNPRNMWLTNTLYVEPRRTAGIGFHGELVPRAVMKNSIYRRYKTASWVRKWHRASPKNASCTHSSILIPVDLFLATLDKNVVISIAVINHFWLFNDHKWVWCHATWQKHNTHGELW